MVTPTILPEDKSPDGHDSVPGLGMRTFRGKSGQELRFFQNVPSLTKLNEFF